MACARIRRDCELELSFLFNGGDASVSSYHCIAREKVEEEILWCCGIPTSLTGYERYWVNGTGVDSRRLSHGV